MSTPGVGIASEKPRRGAAKRTALHTVTLKQSYAHCKALKADQIFGFLSPSQSGTMRVGTLARIRSSRFKDDDAKDGSCHLTVADTRMPTLPLSLTDLVEPGCTRLTLT